MIADVIKAAHLATTLASMATPLVVVSAMSHANIIEPTGKVVEPLLQSCRVPYVQEGGPKDPV